MNQFAGWTLAQTINASTTVNMTTRGNDCSQSMILKELRKEKIKRSTTATPQSLLLPITTLTTTRTEYCLEFVIGGATPAFLGYPNAHLCDMLRGIASLSAAYSHHTGEVPLTFQKLDQDSLLEKTQPCTHENQTRGKDATD